MKRVLASILMTAVLLLSLSVPAAGELIEYDYPRNTVLLWNADENWANPGGFVVDTENQTEGEGCVSIELGKHSQFITQVTFPNVDATGMRYLEFDVYVSDLAILEAWLALEGDSIGISSSGQPDRAEKRIQLSRIAMQLFTEGCPRIGWNHIVISLEELSDIEGAGGKLDLSQVNFLRIFIISWSLASVPEAKDWILKFDNFVLTDREVEPGVPHTPGEWQYDEEKHRRYCVNCGELLGEALHCPEGGCESTGKCKVCELECGSYEHEYALTTPTYLYLASDPTCTEAARIYYCCVRCWERSEETFEFGESLGHDLTEGYVSCGAEGHSMKCRRCNVYVDVISHHFDGWVTVREATETESGLKKRGCMMCSYVETQELTYTAPEEPELPDLPQTPEEPELPDLPQTPEEPELPDLPQTPEEPELPDLPQTPDQPTEPTDNGCSSVVASGTFLYFAMTLPLAAVLRKKKK